MWDLSGPHTEWQPQHAQLLSTLPLTVVRARWWPAAYRGERALSLTTIIDSMKGALGARSHFKINRLGRPHQLSWPPKKVCYMHMWKCHSEHGIHGSVIDSTSERDAGGWFSGRAPSQDPQ